MSVYASEMRKFRMSPEYPSESFLNLKRTRAESELEVKLSKKTGAEEVKVDVGYTKVVSKRGYLPWNFIDVLAGLRDSKNVVFQEDEDKKGFVIRNPLGSEFVKVRDKSSRSHNRAEMEYSNVCLDSKVYREIIDRVAKRIGLDV
jgi:hypothetical protein